MCHCKMRCLLFFFKLTPTWIFYLVMTANDMVMIWYCVSWKENFNEVLTVSRTLRLHSN